MEHAVPMLQEGGKRGINAVRVGPKRAATGSPLPDHAPVLPQEEGKRGINAACVGPKRAATSSPPPDDPSLPHEEGKRGANAACVGPKRAATGSPQTDPASIMEGDAMEGVESTEGHGEGPTQGGPPNATDGQGVGPTQGGTPEDGKPGVTPRVKGGVSVRSNLKLCVQGLKCTAPAQMVPTNPTVLQEDRCASTALASVFLWDSSPLTPVAVGVMHTGVSNGGNEIR